MGWEALGQWGDDVVRIEPLTGGVGVNEVWSVRVNGHLAVGRLGQRSDTDLAWETDLLRHLGREGMPVPVPSRHGRPHFAGGLVVMTHVEGGSPETEAAGVASPAHSASCTGSRTAGPSARAGDRRPAFCTPGPGRGPTPARCRLRVSSGAGQRGRG